MKVNQSPLEIVDYAVLNFELNFIPPNGPDEIPQSYFEKYDIDLDFDIRSNDLLRIFMRTKINQKGLPGYKITAAIACVFKFKENIALTEKERENIQGYSSIYISLNTLRGFISQFTANGPIGRYMFPSIDLNQLIEEKKMSYRNSHKNEGKTAEVKPSTKAAKSGKAENKSKAANKTKRK